MNEHNSQVKTEHNSQLKTEHNSQVKTEHKAAGRIHPLQFEFLVWFHAVTVQEGNRRREELCNSRGNIVNRLL